MGKFALRGIVVAVAAALLAFGLTGSTVFADPVPGDGQNTIQVTPSDAGKHGIGANVVVDVDIVEAEIGYQAMQFKLAWADATVDYVSATYVGPAGCLAGPPTTTSPGTDPEAVWGGCAFAAPGHTDTGTFFEVELQCSGMGVTALHLESIAEDPTFGSATAAAPGAPDPTVLQDSTVECAQMADVQTSKDAPATALAGDVFDYVTTAHNAGPNPALGVIIGDNLPEMPIPDDPASVPQKIFLGAELTYNGAPDVCFPGFLASFTHPLTSEVMLNIVLCDLSYTIVGIPGVMMPSDTVVLTVTVEVPLYDAGKLNVNVSQAGSLVTEDPDESNEADCAPLGLDPANLGCAMTMVLPADITITKEADAAVYSEGATILYDIEATSNGPSKASGVVLFDEVGANQEMTYCFALVTPPPPDMVWPCDCVIGDADTDTLDDCTCDCTGQAIEPGGVIGMAVDADVVGSVGNECVNDVNVSWADGELGALGADASSSVVCLPPTIAMQKDIDDDATTIVDATNLFLEMGPDGLECLTVYELVSNAVNLAPIEGVGAYEFQLKFDHKIFDIAIEDSSWLSVEGARTVDCTMTIVTENDIRFGCVSSGPLPGATAGFGPDAEVVATIEVCPEPDLVNRLTPGQENGVVRTLLDENCQLASPLGDPLQIEVEGDLVPAPGILPGGLLEVCSDMTITVRILEADLNLDCLVNVLDEQAIAFRYGAFFGNLLYDPWYDLEPALKDFDIDIKDLQKVFGRDGSTCVEPIPAQDPFPAPPW
ncbi:MAG: hypothetical protein WBF37_03520 [Dehalococcoidia bacterium]